MLDFEVPDRVKHVFLDHAVTWLSPECGGCGSSVSASYIGRGQSEDQGIEGGH